MSLRTIQFLHEIRAISRTVVRPGAEGLTSLPAQRTESLVARGAAPTSRVDHFAGTLRLDEHLADYGNGWNKTGVFGSLHLKCTGGSALAGTAPTLDGDLYTVSWPFVGNDGTVYVDLHVGATATPGTLALYARGTGAGAGLAAGDGYYAQHAGSVGWSLNRRHNGTVTALGTAPPAVLTAGSVYAVRFGLAGAALTLEVDGSALVTAADTVFPTAGSCGIYIGKSGTASGYQAQSFGIIAAAGNYPLLVTGVHDPDDMRIPFMVP